MSGWTAVLVQADGAEGADRETDLLSETHKKPVDLTPQLPAIKEPKTDFNPAGVEALATWGQCSKLSNKTVGCFHPCFLISHRNSKF